MKAGAWSCWLGSAAAAFLGCQGLAHADCYGAAPGKPQTRFVLDGGEARDSRTGLTWKRCSVGLAWDGSGRCVGTLAALNFEMAQAEAGKAGAGWHVPNGAELQSLIDHTCGIPPVDKSVFPDIEPNAEGLAKYWTTSPVGTLDLFYTFDFMDGQPDGNSQIGRASCRERVLILV